jgi:hypothetical protein
MNGLHAAGTLVRRLCPLAPVVFALFTAGCATTGDLLLGAGDAPPKGNVTQINVAWHNQVVFAPDQVNGGRVSPGLVGRLYLFGPNMGYPLAGDGAVVVDLLDPAQVGKDGEPKMLERWVIQKEHLPLYARQDCIGWGYTLLLPWGTYRPDLTRVVLKVRYDPLKGPSIYTPPSTVTLNPVLDIEASQASRTIGEPKDSAVVPASHQSPSHSR